MMSRSDELKSGNAKTLGPLIKPMSPEDSSTAGGTVRLIAILLICFGIFARFANVNSTPVWHDEVNLILRINGYTRGEVEKLIANRIIPASDLSHMHESLGPPRDVSALIDAVKYDSPEHPPTYGLLGFYWAKYFGYSEQSFRWLSSTIGVLAILGAFWLGTELIGTFSGGLLVAALVCASPLLVFYSQEIREYCLYILATILSTAALLRGCRICTPMSWIIYALCCAFGCNGSVLFIEVLMAHACYMIWRERTQLRISEVGLDISSRLLGYVLATSGAIALWLPYLCTIFFPSLSVMAKHTSYLEAPAQQGSLLNAILFNPGAIFYWIRYSNPAAQNAILGLLFPSCLIWMLVTFNRSRRNIFPFLFFYFVPLIVLFWLPDLLFGMQFSLMLRYYLLVPLAMLMFAAFAVYQHAHAPEPGLKLTAVFGLLFIAGCEVSSDLALQTLRDREVMDNQSLSAIADLQEREGGGLIVSGENGKIINCQQIIALSYALPENSKFLWLDHPTLPQLPPEIKSFYLYAAPQDLVINVAKSGYILKPQPGMPYLIKATHR